MAFGILALVGGIIGLIVGFEKLKGSITSGCIDACIAPIIWGTIFGYESTSSVLCVIFGFIGGFIAYWIIYGVLRTGLLGGLGDGGDGFSGGGGDFGGGGASGDW